MKKRKLSTVYNAEGQNFLQNILQRGIKQKKSKLFAEYSESLGTNFD
jgi:hypothetical protein